MSSLLLPTVYLGGCIAAMSAFSYVYRRASGKERRDEIKGNLIVC